MLLAAGKARLLGVWDARLRIGEELRPEGVGSRLLWVDEQPTFYLSFWCGTCPVLFERIGGDLRLSLEALRLRLAKGVTGLDEDVIEQFGALLHRTSYIPLLIRIEPRLVAPGGPGDYFAEEQLVTWKMDANDPKTPYYRSYETAVDSNRHLFEFIVPMVPPSWNDYERVEHYVRLLRESSLPTAVAVSILDIAQPAITYEAQTPDDHEHWLFLPLPARRTPQDAGGSRVRSPSPAALPAIRRRKPRAS